MSTNVRSPEDPTTRFAGERTLLAWVRTSLAMMGFGFVVARFGLFLREIARVGNLPKPSHSEISLIIGTILVLAGVCVSLLAAWEHAGFLQRMEQRLPYKAPRWSLGIIGVLMAAHLVSLHTGFLASATNPVPNQTVPENME